MRHGTREAPRFGHNTRTEGVRVLEKEDNRITVVERKLPMVTAEKEKVLKSNNPTTENSNKGMETNKSGELRGGTESIHESWRAGRVESDPGNMPSSLGKEASEVEQQQKVIEGGMQWETTTHQEENQRFTFKMKQGRIEAGPKESAKKLDDETGPIAVIFDKEKGETGKFGPTKRALEKAGEKGPNESPKGGSRPGKNEKRESSGVTRAGCYYQ